MNIQCPHFINQNNYVKSLQGYKIYKDQCVRCFHQPSDHNGLYVCMKCYNSFCQQHRQQHQHDQNHPIYINYKMTIKKNQTQPQQITKLAIGKQGGAILEDQYQSSYRVYCNLCKTSELDNSKLLDGQLQSFINTDSPFKKQNLVSWELQINPCEHTLTLEQDPKNNQLSKCTNCQLSTNLWLCLTCGNTGCGRKNWDGTGGNNHGINHYQQTKHPLVVKLGTITTEGQASLYCYLCNNDVKDPLLKDHLNILGLNISSQKKTQKTVVEINLDLNLNFTLSKLVEGKENENQPIYGKQYTGMNNIGNSCYLNSVVQTINSLEQFQINYYHQGRKHIQSCKRIPSQCFYCQISKISIGLNSGKYSQKLIKKRIINNNQVIQQYQKGIKPYDFKLLIAQNNTQFLSTRQQDALEYLQILLERFQKQQPNFTKLQINKLFKYNQTNKLSCTKCLGYKLINSTTNQWKFPIPQPTKEDIQKFYKKLENQQDLQIKKSKQCQDPQYDVSFNHCLHLLTLGDHVSVKCNNCQDQTIFQSRNYFRSTPKYLLAVANRFILEKWVPKKLNALLQFDSDRINLSEFLLENAKNQGFLINQQKKGKQKNYSQENLQMLINMGYHKNAAIRGLIAEKNNLQAAMNWIMDNYDKDIQRPIQQQAESNNQTNIDPNIIKDVCEMGFEQIQAKIALIKFKSNVPAAIQWLFNIGGDVTPFIDLLQPAKKDKKEQLPAGKNYKEYQLISVIVHLGKSVDHGHYVAYLKKNKQWVLYNDQKVTIPKNALIGKGYLYLFKGIQ